MYGLDCIFKFVASNYGSLSGSKFKTAIEESYDFEGNLTDDGFAKVKEIFNTILIKEIAKTYKVPNNVSLTSPFYNNVKQTTNNLSLPRHSPHLTSMATTMSPHKTSSTLKWPIGYHLLKM